MGDMFNALKQTLHKKKNQSYYQLKSALEPDLWDIYPRPQMKRKGWQCLNGIWKIRGKDGDKSIRVPFPPQAELSGYECAAVSEIPEEMLYERNFTVSPGLRTGNGERILLHFGAVDQIAQIFINGRPLMTHEGGYLPFSLDITDAIRPDGEENLLSVFVQDHLDHKYPWGKQKKDRGGMWYTPVSGIWQTVWLEAVPARHIEEVRFTPVSLAAVKVEIQVEECGHPDSDVDPYVDKSRKNQRDGQAPEYTVLTEQGEIRGFFAENTEKTGTDTDTKSQASHKISAQTGRTAMAGVCYTTVIDLKDAAHLWTPEDPYLYSIEITAEEDHITSYFALRTVGVRTINGKKWICLNDKPVFLSGVLDQGYFCDGLFLPANPTGYEQDILRMKELGFRMLRKHIKVEPEQFYYDCDRLGMLVMQDMVNSGPYSFLLDTALPTAGWKKHPKRSFAGGTAGQKETKAFFLKHARETIRHLHSHPCIVGWTVFNEGWGQFDSDRVGDLLADEDPTRFFDYTSGWFEGKHNQVESIHEYFHPGVLRQKEKPLLLTEFGGISMPVENHVYAVDESYGYGSSENEKNLTERILDLYRSMIYPSIAEGLGGFVYTQVSDIEDEINGFYTYDRLVRKVDPEKILLANKKADELLREAVKEDNE